MQRFLLRADHLVLDTGAVGLTTRIQPGRRVRHRLGRAHHQPQKHRRVGQLLASQRFRLVAETLLRARKTAHADQKSTRALLVRLQLVADADGFLVQTFLTLLQTLHLLGDTCLLFTT